MPKRTRTYPRTVRLAADLLGSQIKQGNNFGKYYQMRQFIEQVIKKLIISISCPILWMDP